MEKCFNEFYAFSNLYLYNFIHLLPEKGKLKFNLLFNFGKYLFSMDNFNRCVIIFKLKFNY